MDKTAFIWTKITNLIGIKYIVKKIKIHLQIHCILFVQCKRYNNVGHDWH